MYKENFNCAKVAALSISVKLGEIEENARNIVEAVKKLPKDITIAVFQELCLTGYSCQDLFLRKDFHIRQRRALDDIARETAQLVDVLVVGAALRINSKLYNCAVVMNDGRVVGIVPKTYLANHDEFYEDRWFSPAEKDMLYVGADEIPFGTNLIFCMNGASIHFACEICEDLWAMSPPSERHASHGANMILNLSASNDIVTKHDYRRDLVRMQSARCNCTYVYTSAGGGESTSDLVYGGHQIIACCGTVLAEGELPVYAEEGDVSVITSIVDLERCDNETIRLKGQMHDNASYVHIECQFINYMRKDDNRKLTAPANPYPFIPSNLAEKEKRCMEIMNIQAQGLAARLNRTGLVPVIGVSGGLDSTLALLVIKEACDMIGRDAKSIIGITMPGFGTTNQTRDSADCLMDELGITKVEIPIKEACQMHLKDIGHKEGVFDVTYENAQARERTQILMDYANQAGGLVIGTGDLSEIALGWATYNGDQMSMYNVNAGVPKTLVKFLIETYASKTDNMDLAHTLQKICSTTISPELLPPDENGEIKQSTEDAIGKYDLHDFFLYYYVRFGFSRNKIAAMAKEAFQRYGISNKQVDETLDLFLKRFRQNQFKRNAMPDGPKVGSVSLSPRGDWRMPSDM